jgi:hypothetical protein
MKIRNGFVSNSSSSSFLIPINALGSQQVNMIKNHIEVTQNWSEYVKGEQEKEIYCDESDRWDIDINEKCVWGYTFMDNFDMRFFLNEIVKVNEKYVYWDGDEKNSNLDLDAINRDILQEERKYKLIEIKNIKYKIYGK